MESIFAINTCMNLRELGSFKLSDAVVFHDQLNPELWRNQHLRPEVKNQLMAIAEDFLDELGVSDLKVKDITVSGSNAAYSYTPHSDLDLHILVDMSQLPNDEIYKELFNAKKTLYNDTHDITVHGVPVELYVQDASLPVVSLGEYSIKQDKWLRIPTKRRANFDQTATLSKYDKISDLIELGLKSRDIEKVDHLIQTIKRYRQAGLDKGGEFGPENLAYKALRSQGYIDDLYNLRDKLHSEILTIENMHQAPVKLDEIGYADALGSLNMPDSKIISLSTQDGTISQKPVMKFKKGNATIYFFSDSDKISALILLADASKLRAIKNFSGQPGQVFALLNHIVNVNNIRLVITPDEPLTKEGFQWIAKLIKNPTGLKVSDLNGNPVDIDMLKHEWEKSRSTHGTESGTTGIVISESSIQWKTRLQENEASIMPYVYFKVDEEELNEASGYIPSEKEKNDPRFKTALTVDIKPDSIKKNAKAFGFKTTRAGIPPLLR